MSVTKRPRNGEEVVHEWIEHELDESLVTSHEIGFTLPPTGLIERIDELVANVEAASEAREQERIREVVKTLDGSFIGKVALMRVLAAIDNKGGEGNG